MASTDKPSRRYESREPRGGGDNYHGSDGGKYAKESKYDDPPHSRLFIVCGKTITEEDFRESFSKYGTIEEIWVVKDRNTEEPKVVAGGEAGGGGANGSGGNDGGGNGSGGGDSGGSGGNGSGCSDVGRGGSRGGRSKRGGVTYIKFSKTSEAALAMEEMNGRCIGGHPRPLKVLIAHSREQGSRRDMNEEERLLRLFVVVPKSLSESDLREHFAQFGDIDYVSIVRDRSTRDSKGFAYVKYHRMSHSAKAFESCDRTFKPVFADPKPQKSDGLKFDGRDLRGDMRGGNDGYMYSGPIGPHHNNHHSPFDVISYMDTSGLNPEGVTRLTVIASPTLNQDQLWKLFDLIPGLDYCDLRKDRKSGQMPHGGRGVATVVYNNPQSATYAREKLHGFEYPPGQRLIVKLDPHHDMPPGPPPMMPGGPGGPGFGGLPRGVGGGLAPPPHNGTLGGSPPGGMGPGGPPSGGQPNSNIQQNLAQLAETIAQATSLIQAAGLNTGPGSMSNQVGNPGLPGGDIYDPSYCSVKLPPPQPLAPVDSNVAERLFIVCHPSPPPIYALKDVFGRFGSLIDIYMLSGKTFGYAKFATKESADKAIVVLHGQEVLGSRLKVMEADPHDKADSGRKRLRIDDQS